MNRLPLAITLAGGLLVSGASSADEKHRANPYRYPDDTYVSVNGEVEAVTADAFTLDFDGGVIVVEMDDGDRDADAYKLLEGDRVTVHGLIDDDFFESKTIEASSVYVEKLGTRFYASAIDEEDYGVDPVIPDPDSIVVQGRITDVDESEFTVDTGMRSFRVDVKDMPYDPLDDEGYQRLEIGDVVSVTGDVDVDFLEGREIMADSVTTIHDFG